MGNHVLVMNGERKPIGRMNHGLASFVVVKNIVDKYAPGRGIEMMTDPDIANDILKPVYEQCEPWEEVQLLVYISDKSSFDASDIPSFKKAIETYDDGSGPHKTLTFLLKLLVEHSELITEYQDTSVALAVSG